MEQKYNGITMAQLVRIAKGPVNLIHDEDGMVIGNSQHLALTVIALAKAVERLASTIEIGLIFYSEKIDEFMILNAVDFDGAVNWQLAEDSVLRPKGAPDTYTDDDYEGVDEHNLDQDWVLVCNL